MSLAVRLIPGGLHRDKRGEVRHVNGFSFERVDRFYTVQPAQPGEVRGWVGHRRDWKWFFAVKGNFVIGVVRPNDWANPSPTEPVLRWSLSADAAAVLEVPPGHFTAARADSEGAILIVFSSGGIEHAGEDDFRQSSDFWQLA